jgi:sarcosine oxidase gamma subunit
VVDPNGVLVMRLASSEFLIEAVDADLESGTSTRARLLQPAHAAGVYPVVRQDLTVGISGKGLNGLLRQICSVDFLPLLETDALDGGPIILTSMIGVGVIAWPRRLDAEPALTLWCDPSFAHYFWSTLLEVARGSGAVTINPPADWTGV